MNAPDWTRITAVGLFPSDVEDDGTEPPNPDEVAIATEWLRLFARPSKRKTGDTTSYGLKHAVEAWAEGRGSPQYVANGALIEAARRLGYVVERDGRGSPNAVFNLRIGRKACNPRT